MQTLGKSYCQDGNGLFNFDSSDGECRCCEFSDALSRTSPSNYYNIYKAVSDTEVEDTSSNDVKAAADSKSVADATAAADVYAKCNEIELCSGLSCDGYRGC